MIEILYFYDDIQREGLEYVSWGKRQVENYVHELERSRV